MSELSQERLKQLLTYNPETGVFLWRVFRGGLALKGSVAGRTDTKGYRQITVDWVAIAAHRLAFLYIDGTLPGDEYEVDHIDGVRQNNAFANLRIVTKSQNQQNLAECRRSNKSAGLLGVSYDRRSGRYMARITVCGKVTHIGRFATAELAHAAYCIEKAKQHSHSCRLKGLSNV